MSNLHRIAWIDSQIRAGAFPNCTTIAAHFEISRRQAMRDVEYLRDSMGAPLGYSAERKGYFYGEDSYVLPSLIISEGKKRTLSYLAAAYSGMGSAAGLKLAVLFKRIAESRGRQGEAGAAEGGTGDIPVIPLEAGEQGVYSALMDAIAGKYAVQIAYTNAQGKSRSRPVSPYRIFRNSFVNYMVGYCHLKAEIRIFRLGRIADIGRAETPFFADPGFREERYGETVSLDYSHPYTARISLEGRTDPGILKHSFSRLPDGGLVVEFRDSTRLIAALLGLDAAFVVREPAWLREKLEKKIASIAKKNFRWDIICHTPSGIVEPLKTKEGDMGKKIIEGAAMCGTWTAYIAAAEGCLKAAGLWKDEAWKMMGLSGMGFHFIVHKTLCPSSVTVYDWNFEHVSCMDRMGFLSETFGIMFDGRHNTFADAREKAVQRIKESIDRGIPAVVWGPTPIPEFGVVNGYDDGDKVFFVEQCNGQPADPLLYDNLGKTSDVPILAYQIFYKRIPVDAENYASGIKGYANFIGALEKGPFDDFGIGYLTAVYADSKAALARYLDWAAARPDAAKPLGKAAKLFGKTTEKWAAMAKIFPFSGASGKTDTPPDKKRAGEALALVKDAFELENEAMEEIGKAMKG